MSSGATSSKSKKAGRGQNKRFWTTKEDDVLVSSLLELYHDPKWRADTGFKNGYLQKLQDMIEAKLPNCGILANPHIESRIKTLKGKYVALSEALSQSGFGWNEEAMMLDCERSVFDEWAKNKKDAKGLYGKPFEHYYALGEIYGKDRAMGTNDGNAEDDEEEVREEDASMNQEVVRADDFFEQMNMTTDGGSQYRGSQFEGLGETEDNDTSFIQPSPPQPPSAKQRAKQQRSTQDVTNAPNNTRRKARALDDMAKKFGVITEAVAGMAPKFEGLINVLSTDKDLADMQGKLGGELRKMDFLSPLQVFHVTNKLAKEHDLLRVFFTMTDKEKKDYIINLLQYGLQ
ncbi:uncharacterized protein LOC112164088 [Rosa chinensis]|uniref:uncharacterized protein LOC112164088 n=1 Tax=Rosa chinensis TaxID=74649 RepID=UPI000D0977AB|nr:uncharacterized protein LOC112164088 [Rosa chinensis]